MTIFLEGPGQLRIEGSRSLYRVDRGYDPLHLPGAFATVVFRKLGDDFPLFTHEGNVPEPLRFSVGFVVGLEFLEFDPVEPEVSQIDDPTVLPRGETPVLALADRSNVDR